MSDCKYAFLLQCLIGNRYGNTPLPKYLEESEFDLIRQEAFEAAKGKALSYLLFITSKQTEFPCEYHPRNCSVSP